MSDDLENLGKAVRAIDSHLLRQELADARQRIDAALNLAKEYGGTDGSHHKAWVIDQMCRCLLGYQYDKFVSDAKAGEDGPDTYDWDEGIAP